MLRKDCVTPVDCIMIGFIERLLLGPIKAKTCLNKRVLEPLQAVSAVPVLKNEIMLIRGARKPIIHKFNEEIVKVVGGMDHYMILSSSGKLYTFGSNEHGQLGTDICKNVTLWSSLRVDDDTEEVYDEPQLISTMNGEDPCTVVDIAAGHFSSFAVTAEHRLYAWGAGILGVGDEYFDTRPQRISLKDVVNVQVWRDLVLAKTGKNEKYIFGATLEDGIKVLKPTLCEIDSLPESTDEHPDMPIHYFSHNPSTTPTFTIPTNRGSTSNNTRVYRNYNYAIYY